MNKGYDIFTADFSEFYIPEALHIERVDDLMMYENDEKASKQAEKDGMKLIYGMNAVPDGVYLDTQENRDIIVKMLKQYPKYEKWGAEDSAK